MLRKIAVLAMLLMAPAPAWSAPQADAVPVSELSESSVFVLVQSAIDQGEYDTARLIVGQYRPGDPDHAARVRFVEGLVLEAQGDAEGATSIYRGILADRPDIVGVRVKLAQSLYATRADEAARYQLEQLVASGVDERLNGQLGTLIDRIDQRRPLKVRGYVSFLPSTNLNSGTDAETVVLGGVPLQIDPSARRNSGLGILFGGDLSYQRPLTGDVSLLASLSALDRYYPSVDVHQASVAGSLGLARTIGATRLGVSAIAGRDMSEWTRAYDYVGINLEGSQILASDVRVTAGAAIRHQWFDRSPLRDGWNVDGQIYLDKFLSPSRFVRAIGGAQAERTKIDRLDFDEGTIGLGGFNEFAYGISVYAEGTVSLREYGGDFPGLTEPRSDTRLRGRGVITKRDLSFYGVAPQLSYTFTRNRSNSVFDDYAKHDVELRLTSEF